MKSLNAKRIAAVAASLAIGLAFAGSVSFSNVPIINSAGQPVVQIVVGSQAKPSDGVVAANIAAVIGSLAYTSTPITATISGTNAVSCAVTTSTCALTNQQVWLKEQGTATASGSFSISALIGSVLNDAAKNYNTLSYTKSAQTSGSYTYPEGSSSPYSITVTPTAPSLFTGYLTQPGDISTIIPSQNGGGVSFNSYIHSPDNVLRLGQTQVPSLLYNSGDAQESEYLWVMGFPVFNQGTTGSPVNEFQLLDANVGYQIQFGKPIHAQNSDGTVNHQSFTFLGQNWTTYSFTAPTATGSAVPTSSQFITGGKLQLAQSMSPVQTVYVGHNVTSGPFTVVLQDLSQPNSNGISSAAVAVYNNGVLTNETSIFPGNTLKINSTGTPLYVSVSQTFAGLYAYQKWAKIQLYSNIINVTSDGKTAFNSSNNDWIPILRWSTNQTSIAGFTQAQFNANAALQGIILYRSNATTLTSGQSINVLSSPAAWTLTFVGDSLGTPSGNSNYDALTFGTSSTTTQFYQNPKASQSGAAAATSNYFYGGAATGFAASNANAIPYGNATALREPANLFTVTSGLTGAFSVTSSAHTGTTTSTLQYNLDSYQLTENAVAQANSVSDSANGLYIVINAPANANVAYLNSFMGTSNPLTITISGYKAGSKYTDVSSLEVGSNIVQITTLGTGTNTIVLPQALIDNVSAIKLGTAIPAPGINVYVYDSANLANTVAGAPVGTTNLAAVAANTVYLASLTYNGPQIQYSLNNQDYLESATTNPADSANAVVQYQGQQAQVGFTLSAITNVGMYANGIGSNINYFTYNVPELALPTSTTPDAYTVISLDNASAASSPMSSPFYWVNVSSNGGNKWTYVSSTQSTPQSVAMPVGFRTERGSELGSMSTSTATYYMAKSVDTLQFLVAPSNSTITTGSKITGPYGIGQSTDIANVSIYNVTASCGGTGSNVCSVVGLSNLTATPSVSAATTPVKLDTSATPLAVLDSNANNASSLVVVGSKYVNSVAAQIFAQNPSLDSSFGPSSTVTQAFGNKILVAGYTADQTVQAGNQFIQDLLTAAGQ